MIHYHVPPPINTGTKLETFNPPENNPYNIIPSYNGGERGLLWGGVEEYSTLFTADHIAPCPCRAKVMLNADSCGGRGGGGCSKVKLSEF